MRGGEKETEGKGKEMMETLPCLHINMAQSLSHNVILFPAIDWGREERKGSNGVGTSH